MRQGGNHASMRKNRKVKLRRETMMKSSTERRLNELQRITGGASAAGQDMEDVQSLFQSVADHIVLLELKVCLLKAAVSCFHGGGGQ